MLDKFRTALVLIVIGAIAGALIWGVNEATYERIAQNRIDKELNFYKDIFDLEFDLVLEDVEKTILDDELLEEQVIINDKSGNFVGVIYKATDKNNYGEVTVLIGIDSVNGTIKQVVISNTSNTPTFSKKIEKNHLDPFSGQPLNGYTIDEKTGATFTYTSVVEMVEAATAYYQESWGE